MSSLPNVNLNLNTLGFAIYVPHGSSGTATFPSTVTEEPVEHSGECFSVSVNNDECFSVSVSESDCFYVKTGEEEGIELPAPNTLHLDGFSKIRDMIKLGDLDLLILGLYTPQGYSERPVLAKITYVTNTGGDIKALTHVEYFEDLSTYDGVSPIDIDTCSLEAYNTTSSISNYAIKTDTEVIYISPVILLEVSRTGDTDALLYPFAKTDTTYWTNTEYWDGSYLPPSKIHSSHVYETNMYSDVYYTSQANYPEMNDILALAGRVFGRDYLLYDEDYVEYNETLTFDINGSPYYSHVKTRHSLGTDMSTNIKTGYQTISKKITDSSVIYDSGSNHFTSKIEKQTIVVDEFISQTILPYVRIYNFQGAFRGDYGISKALPTEVDLTLDFLNMRDDYIFGEGYIAIGANVATQNTYIWEKIQVNTYGWYATWYQGGGIFPTGDEWIWRKKATGYVLDSQSDVGTTDIIKVPFTSANTKKVQVGSDWITMGIVGVSTDYAYVVDDIPEAFGNPACIVGDRALIPIEIPTIDNYGNIIIVDQSYSLDDNKVATREVIFP